MAYSRLAAIMAGLTVIGLVLGIAIGNSAAQDLAPVTLGAAEVVKLASALVMWRLALAGHTLLLRLGALTMALAGACGLAAIAAQNPAIGQAVTPLALTAVALTGIWGTGIARQAGARLALAIAAAMTLLAVASLAAPPLGLLLALVSLAFWTVATRRFPEWQAPSGLIG